MPSGTGKSFSINFDFNLLNKLFISSMSSLESIGPGARTFENLIIPLFCKTNFLNAKPIPKLAAIIV